MTKPAALATVLMAAILSLILVTQVFVTSANQTDLSFGGVIWRLVRFFTILTNLMLALAFIRMAATRRYLSVGWLAALTLWILIVGIVYHTLLAHLENPQGLGFWTDQGLHTFAPAAMALWWLAFAPKAGLRWGHAAVWLAWPLIYVIYALVRGALDGTYPYPFVDVSELGYQGVLINAIGLCAAFYVSGLALVALGRAMARRAGTQAN